MYGGHSAKIRGGITPAFSTSHHLSLARHHGDLDHPSRHGGGADDRRGRAGLVAGVHFQRTRWLAELPCHRRHPHRPSDPVRADLVAGLSLPQRRAASGLGPGLWLSQADGGTQQRDHPGAFHSGRRRHFRAGLDRPRRIPAMNSAQTPLHKVQGMGSSHSGTGHFWHERVTAVALIPLSLWFLYVMLGLAGTSEVTALQYLAHPWNALLMGAFVSFSLWHAYLGVQVVIDDYIHTAGTKIFLLLFTLLAVIAVGVVSLFAIVRIAAL